MSRKLKDIALDGTVKLNQRFVEQCLAEGGAANPLVLVELLNQEWRVYLVSQQSPSSKERINTLRSEAVKLRNTLKEKLGEQNFQEFYKFMHQNCDYRVSGEKVPMFNDNGYPANS